MSCITRQEEQQRSQSHPSSPMQSAPGTSRSKLLPDVAGSAAALAAAAPVGDVAAVLESCV